MKIADRLKALKIAALKKQKELMELQADTAFGRELMRLQHLKELETDQGEAGGAACCSDEALYWKEDQARGLLQVLDRVLKAKRDRKKLLR